MKNFIPFKKEKPFLGFSGYGGGAGGLVLSSSVKTPITATGGTKNTPGDGYIYHWFTSNGNLSISDGDAAMDVLIVGGGGGGGYDRGGGGGAGAFYPLTLNGAPGTHPITLGTGGAGDTSAPGADGGTPGGDTTFTYNSTPYVANGGGGGSGDAGTNGLDSPGNGSGGGTTGSPVNASPWDAGTGGAYGNPGKGSSRNGTGGGGGGAGSGGPNAGYQPETTTTAQVGGNGKTLPWIPASYGSGGIFAGGGGGDAAGGNGGNGIVLIRYEVAS